MGTSSGGAVGHEKREKHEGNQKATLYGMVNVARNVKDHQLPRGIAATSHLLAAIG